MRRIWAFFESAVLLVFLCACSARDPYAFGRRIQEDLAGARTLAMTAEITADYGDSVYDFRVRYGGDCAAGAMEILAPASVAGLQVRVDAAGVTLLYDGAALETGSLFGDGLTPVSAIPFLLNRWTNGYLTDAYFTGIDGADAVCLTWSDGSGTAALTWFETETGLPIQSEITRDNYTVIRCVFENVSFEP